MPIQAYFRKSRFTISGWTTDWVISPGVERDHHGAVLRLRHVERANGHETSGAGHVLNDDRRMARNVVGDEAGQGAGIGVVAAAGTEADNDGDRLAFVEIIGSRQRRRRYEGGREEWREKGRTSPGHSTSPLMACAIIYCEMPARKPKIRDGIAMSSRSSRDLAEIGLMRHLPPERPMRTVPINTGLMIRQARSQLAGWHKRLDEWSRTYNVASISARSSGVTSGMMPNQAWKAGRAWCSSMPSPFTVRLPRRRAAASSGVSRGI